MTHPVTPKIQTSDVDIAYHLLMTQGRSRNYYDLIQDVLKEKNLAIEPGLVSAVLTQINLDTRFTYLGQGEWGLRAWISGRGSRKSLSMSLMNKAVADSDDEADLDEDEEEKDLLEEDADSVQEDDSYKKSSRRSEEDS